ncbi:FHA domain-containing protein [Pseudonocardia spinosispora]|uniref:FHA domain-containing protein n=1 Tax=Pseudonocardia spinosispora TaxID=103441 RepID=UPI0012EC73AC|nr:FHA domain-containing protein [Pseudonocardia spinosispora]
MSVDFWVNATFLDANASFFVIGTVAAIAGWHGRKNPTRTSKKWKHVARWTTNNAYLAVLASIPLMGIQLTEPNYHLEPTQFLLIWSTYLAWTGESVFAMWHDYKTWRAERAKAAAHKAPQAQALFWGKASAASLGTYGIVYLLTSAPVLASTTGALGGTLALLMWVINRNAPPGARVTPRSAVKALVSPKGITAVSYAAATAAVATTIGLGPIPGYVLVGALISFADRGITNVVIQRLTNLPDWIKAVLLTNVAVTWMVNLSLHLPAAFHGGIAGLDAGLFAAAESLFLIGAVPAAKNAIIKALPTGFTDRHDIREHTPDNQFTRWAGWLSVPTITVAAGVLGYTFFSFASPWYVLIPIGMFAAFIATRGQSHRALLPAAAWFIGASVVAVVSVGGHQWNVITAPVHALPIVVLTGAFLYLTQTKLAGTPAGEWLAASRLGRRIADRHGDWLLKPWTGWKSGAFLNAPNTGGLALASYGLIRLWMEHLPVAVPTTIALGTAVMILRAINRRAGPAGPAGPGAPRGPAGPSTPDANGHGHDEGEPSAFDGTPASDQAARLRAAKAAWISLGIMGAASGIQLWLGAISHSPLVTADGYHNLFDLLPGLLAIAGARIASTRFDQFANRVIGLAILGSGLVLGYEALTAGSVDLAGPVWLPVVAGVVSIAGNLGTVALFRNIPGKVGEANLEHAIGDAIGSGMVIVGGLVALLGIPAATSLTATVGTVFISGVIALMGLGVITDRDIDLLELRHPRDWLTQVDGATLDVIDLVLGAVLHPVVHVRNALAEMARWLTDYRVHRVFAADDAIALPVTDQRLPANLDTRLTGSERFVVVNGAVVRVWSVWASAPRINPLTATPAERTAMLARAARESDLADHHTARLLAVSRSSLTALHVAPGDLTDRRAALRAVAAGAVTALDDASKFSWDATRLARAGMLRTELIRLGDELALPAAKTDALTELDDLADRLHVALTTLEALLAGNPVRGPPTVSRLGKVRASVNEWRNGVSWSHRLAFMAAAALGSATLMSPLYNTRVLVEKVPGLSAGPLAAATLSGFVVGSIATILTASKIGVRTLLTIAFVGSVVGYGIYALDIGAISALTAGFVLGTTASAWPKLFDLMSRWVGATGARRDADFARGGTDKRVILKDGLVGFVMLGLTFLAPNVLQIQTGLLEHSLRYTALLSAPAMAVAGVVVLTIMPDAAAETSDTKEGALAGIRRVLGIRTVLTVVLLSGLVQMAIAPLDAFLEAALTLTGVTGFEELVADYGLVFGGLVLAGLFVALDLLNHKAAKAGTSRQSFLERSPHTFVFGATLLMAAGGVLLAATQFLGGAGHGVTFQAVNGEVASTAVAIGGSAVLAKVFAGEDAKNDLYLARAAKDLGAAVGKLVVVLASTGLWELAEWSGVAPLIAAAGLAAVPVGMALVKRRNTPSAPGSATEGTPVRGSPESETGSSAPRLFSAEWREGASTSHRRIFQSNAAIGVGTAVAGLYLTRKLGLSVGLPSDTLYVGALAGNAIGVILYVTLWDYIPARVRAAGSVALSSAAYGTFAVVSGPTSYQVTAFVLGVLASPWIQLFYQVDDWARASADARHAAADKARKAAEAAGESVTKKISWKTTAIAMVGLGLAATLASHQVLQKILLPYGVVPAVLATSVVGLLMAVGLWFTTPSEKITPFTLRAWADEAFIGPLRALKNPFVLATMGVYSLSAMMLGSFDGLWDPVLKETGAPSLLILLLNYGLIAGDVFIVMVALVGDWVTARSGTERDFLEEKAKPFTLGMAIVMAFGAASVWFSQSVLGDPAIGISINAVAGEAGSVGMIIAVGALLRNQITDVLRRREANNFLQATKALSMWLLGAQLSARTFEGHTSGLAAGWQGVSTQIGLAGAGMLAMALVVYFWEPLSRFATGVKNRVTAALHARIGKGNGSTRGPTGTDDPEAPTSPGHGDRGSVSVSALARVTTLLSAAVATAYLFGMALPMPVLGAALVGVLVGGASWVALALPASRFQRTAGLVQRAANLFQRRVEAAPRPTPAVLIRPGRGEHTIAGTWLSIGSDEHNDLVIRDDQGVSGKHAMLNFSDGAWYVGDVGSATGVRVNQMRIDRAIRLYDGDTLTVGATSFLFHSTGPARPTTPVAAELVPQGGTAPVGLTANPFRIGRDRLLNDLVLADDYGVENQHAELRFHNDSWYVADFVREPGNPTLHENRPITGYTRLTDGDMLTFGDTVFQFRFTAPEPTPAALTSNDGLASHRITGDRVFLGRSGDNWLVLTDPMASRHHAALRFRDGSWWASDLGSANGSTLNGRPLTRTYVRLSDGDKLRFGTTTYVFRDLRPEAMEAWAALAPTLAWFTTGGWWRGSSYVITAKTLFIGRDPERAHLVFTDERVPGQHARLRFYAGAWHLTDLGSTNGTKVNGDRITGSTQLRDRDKITVDGTTLVFHVKADSTPTRAPPADPSQDGPRGGPLYAGDWLDGRDGQLRDLLVRLWHTGYLDPIALGVIDLGLFDHARFDPELLALALERDVRLFTWNTDQGDAAAVLNAHDMAWVNDPAAPLLAYSWVDPLQYQLIGDGVVLFPRWVLERAGEHQRRGLLPSTWLADVLAYELRYRVLRDATVTEEARLAAREQLVGQWLRAEHAAQDGDVTAQVDVAAELEGLDAELAELLAGGAGAGSSWDRLAALRAVATAAELADVAEALRVRFGENLRPWMRMVAAERALSATNEHWQLDPATLRLLVSDDPSSPVGALAEALRELVALEDSAAGVELLDELGRLEDALEDSVTLTDPSESETQVADRLRQAYEAVSGDIEVQALWMRVGFLHGSLVRRRATAYSDLGSTSLDDLSDARAKLDKAFKTALNASTENPVWQDTVAVAAELGFLMMSSVQELESLRLHRAPVASGEALAYLLRAQAKFLMTEASQVDRQPWYIDRPQEEQAHDFLRLYDNTIRALTELRDALRHDPNALTVMLEAAGEAISDVVYDTRTLADPLTPEQFAGVVMDHFAWWDRSEALFMSQDENPDNDLTQLDALLSSQVEERHELLTAGREGLARDLGISPGELDRLLADYDRGPEGRPGFGWGDDRGSAPAATLAGVAVLLSAAALTAATLGAAVPMPVLVAAAAVVGAGVLAGLVKAVTALPARWVSRIAVVLVVLVLLNQPADAHGVVGPVLSAGALPIFGRFPAAHLAVLRRTHAVALDGLEKKDGGDFGLALAEVGRRLAGLAGDPTGPVRVHTTAVGSLWAAAGQVENNLGALRTLLDDPNLDATERLRLDGRVAQLTEQLNGLNTQIYGLWLNEDPRRAFAVEGWDALDADVRRGFAAAYALVVNSGPGVYLHDKTKNARVRILPDAAFEAAWRAHGETRGVPTAFASPRAGLMVFRESSFRIGDRPGLEHDSLVIESAGALVHEWMHLADTTRNRTQGERNAFWVQRLLTQVADHRAALAYLGDHQNGATRSDRDYLARQRYLVAFWDELVRTWRPADQAPGTFPLPSYYDTLGTGPFAMAGSDEPVELIPGGGLFSSPRATLAAGGPFFKKKTQGRDAGGLGIGIERPSGRVVSLDYRETEAAAAATWELVEQQHPTPRVVKHEVQHYRHRYRLPGLGELFQTLQWGTGARHIDLVRYAEVDQYGKWAAFNDTQVPDTRARSMLPAVFQGALRRNAGDTRPDADAHLTIHLSLVLVNHLLSQPNQTRSLSELVAELAGDTGDRVLSDTPENTLRRAVAQHPRLRLTTVRRTDGTTDTVVWLVPIEPVGGPTPKLAVGETATRTWPEPDDSLLIRDEGLGATIHKAFRLFLELTGEQTMDPTTRANLERLMPWVMAHSYWSQTSTSFVQWNGDQPDSDLPDLRFWVSRSALDMFTRDVLDTFDLLEAPVSREEAAEYGLLFLVWHEMAHVLQHAYGLGSENALHQLALDSFAAGLSVPLAIPTGGLTTSLQLETERFAEGLAALLLERHINRTRDDLTPRQRYFLPDLQRSAFADSTYSGLAEAHLGGPTSNSPELPGYLYFHNHPATSAILALQPGRVVRAGRWTTGQLAGTRPELALLTAAEALTDDYPVDPQFWFQARDMLDAMIEIPAESRTWLHQQLLAQLLRLADGTAGPEAVKAMPAGLTSALRGQRGGGVLSTFWSRTDGTGQLALLLLAAEFGPREWPVWLLEMPAKARTSAQMLTMARWAIDRQNQLRYHTALDKLLRNLPAKSRTGFLLGWLDLASALTEFGPRFIARNAEREIIRALFMLDIGMTKLPTAGQAKALSASAEWVRSEAGPAVPAERSSVGGFLVRGGMREPGDDRRFRRLLPDLVKVARVADARSATGEPLSTPTGLLDLFLDAELARPLLAEEGLEYLIEDMVSHAWTHDRFAPFGALVSFVHTSDDLVALTPYLPEGFWGRFTAHELGHLDETWEPGYNDDEHNDDAARLFADIDAALEKRRAEPPVPAVLILRHGKHRMELPLTGSPSTLGRNSRNDLVIAGDMGVSGEHAQLTWTSGAWHLTDLESTNGTKVNHERITPGVPFRLAHGMQITVGTTNLFVNLGGMPVAETPVPTPSDDPAPESSTHRPSHIESRTEWSDPVVAELVRPGGEIEVVAGDPFFIGRDAEHNDLVLADDYSVGDEHARLFFLNGSWHVQDMDATNPTLVNGRPISATTALRTGDRLTFGNTEFTFRLQAPAPVPPTAAAIVARGGGHRWEPQGNRMSIGRHESNDLVVADSKASGFHALLTFFAGAWHLVDSGSMNGTWVNGERITQPRALRDGDQLTIGGRGYVFRDLTRTGELRARLTPSDSRSRSTYLVDGPMEIGADLSNDPRLPGAPGVAAFHAWLSIRAGAWYLTGYGRHGDTGIHETLVNGERIAEATRLGDGDVITIGSVQFVFRLGHGPRTTRGPPTGRFPWGGFTVAVLGGLFAVLALRHGGDAAGPALATALGWLPGRNAPRGEAVLTLGKVSPSDLNAYRDAVRAAAEVPSTALPEIPASEPKAVRAAQLRVVSSAELIERLIAGGRTPAEAERLENSVGLYAIGRTVYLTSRRASELNQPYGPGARSRDWLVRALRLVVTHTLQSLLGRDELTPDEEVTRQQLITEIRRSRLAEARESEHWASPLDTHLRWALPATTTVGPGSASTPGLATSHPALRVVSASDLVVRLRDVWIATSATETAVTRLLPRLLGQTVYVTDELVAELSAHESGADLAGDWLHRAATTLLEQGAMTALLAELDAARTRFTDSMVRVLFTHDGDVLSVNAAVEQLLAGRTFPAGAHQIVAGGLRTALTVSVLDAKSSPRYSPAGTPSLITDHRANIALIDLNWLADPRISADIVDGMAVLYVGGADTGYAITGDLLGANREPLTAAVRMLVATIEQWTGERHTADSTLRLFADIVEHSQPLPAGSSGLVNRSVRRATVRRSPTATAPDTWELVAVRGSRGNRLVGLYPVDAFTDGNGEQVEAIGPLGDDSDLLEAFGHLAAVSSGGVVRGSGLHFADDVFLTSADAVRGAKRSDLRVARSLTPEPVRQIATMTWNDDSAIGFGLSALLADGGRADHRVAVADRVRVGQRLWVAGHQRGASWGYMMLAAGRVLAVDAAGIRIGLAGGVVLPDGFVFTDDGGLVGVVMHGRDGNRDNIHVRVLTPRLLGEAMQQLLPQLDRQAPEIRSHASALTHPYTHAEEVALRAALPKARRLAAKTLGELPARAQDPRVRIVSAEDLERLVGEKLGSAEQASRSSTSWAPTRWARRSTSPTVASTRSPGTSPIADCPRTG